MRPTGQDERERVAEAYAAYRANPAKQRSWRADNPGNQAMRAELVAVAMAMAGERLRSGGRVLDVGCGTGWWLRTLAGTGVPAERLSGADVLPARVERARAAVPGATIVSANARTLPFGDGAFEVVTLFTVLSSLRSPGDQAEVLREAARVLAPGGLLLIWEPRVPVPFNRRTVHLRRATVRKALGSDADWVSLTLLPPLARRLGARTASAYPRLARLPALRTHRLGAYRRP